MKSNPAKRRLRLEMLEIRALLAGDFGADLAQASTAVHGAPGVDIAFSPTSGNHLLELDGHGADALVIDLDRLPSFVTKLSISHFDSVTMIGSDKVEYLIATDVGSLLAPNLSVTAGLYVDNVAAVELAAAGSLAVLTGSKDTTLSVRSLDNTTIISELPSLTLDSQTRVLSVETSNADQIIQLKYHPDKIEVFGIGSESSVRFIDSNATPANPVGGNTGTAVVTTPSTPPGDMTSSDPSIVIIHTLDAQTRALLAELQSLRGSSKDSQRLFLEFLSHSTPDTNPTLSTAGVDARHVFNANLRDLQGALQGMAMDAATTAGIENLGSAGSAAVTASQGITTDKPVDERPLQFLKTYPSTTAASIDIVAIDATWPVAVGPQQATENPHPFVPLGSTPLEPATLKLEDSLRAFTDYVVDRVAAEFSPGQQSLVLLVDPKPTRSGTVNQNSALDLFGSKTRTSIASLRQVMS